ncbi:MAG: energy transducer TonB [Bryobacteraceae bacterium]
MAQSAILGVLVVGPLLYTQALPMVPIFVATFAPPFSPPPVPPVVRTTTESVATSRGLARRVFVGPTRIPEGPIRNSSVDLTNISVVDASIVEPGVPGIGPISIVSALPGLVAELVKPTPEPKPAPVAELKPVRVSSTILAAKILKRIVPAYPVLAKQSHVSGTVRLLATLSKDGRIENLRVIDGPPLLRKAALDAVSQWVYSPTILNGVPVEVEAPIEVNFTLN